jgi:hypothetical protein
MRSRPLRGLRNRCGLAADTWLADYRANALLSQLEASLRALVARD